MKKRSKRYISLKKNVVKDNKLKLKEILELVKKEKKQEFYLKF